RRRPFVPLPVLGGLLAGEGLDLPALGVEDGERRLTLRLLLERVEDHRALWRILPRVEVGPLGLAVGSLRLAVARHHATSPLVVEVARRRREALPAAVCEAVGRARREERHRRPPFPTREPAQRGEVVED